MATVDEIKARIQEETEAFAAAVDALLAELTAPEDSGTTPLSVAAPAAAPEPETEAGAPSGVNTSQQDIIEPTPDPSPEEESGDSSPTSPSPEGGSAPDTTGL